MRKVRVTNRMHELTTEEDSSELREAGRRWWDPFGAGGKSTCEVIKSLVFAIFCQVCERLLSREGELSNLH